MGGSAFEKTVPAPTVICRSWTMHKSTDDVREYWHHCMHARKQPQTTHGVSERKWFEITVIIKVEVVEIPWECPWEVPLSCMP